jgi:uncharacterized protein with LGFP repeats
MGWERSFLGYPVTDELPVPDGVGRFNHFQNGSIYWTAALGTHEVHGAIRNEWAATGWETFLGYPVTNELAAPDGAGRFNHFQNGSIYWSPTTGAHEVHGVIRTEWAATGWEAYLGYPVTDEMRAPDGIGRFNHFQRGSVYWSPTTGAHEVHGAIRDRWASLGWETGALGYPVSDEYAVAGGTRSDFSRGSITWAADTGATTVTLH